MPRALFQGAGILGRMNLDERNGVDKFLEVQPREWDGSAKSLPAFHLERINHNNNATCSTTRGALAWHFKKKTQKHKSRKLTTETPKKRGGGFKRWKFDEHIFSNGWKAPTRSRVITPCTGFFFTPVTHLKGHFWVETTNYSRYPFVKWVEKSGC